VPELPEVETVVRDLRPQLVGQRIQSVTHTSTQDLRKPWDSAWDSLLAGQRVVNLTRRGKWILGELKGDHWLVFHLGMTGQLTLVPASTPLAAHTHLVFQLGKGKRQLRFRDVRRFGSVTLFTEGEQLRRFLDEVGLGPEPFNLDAKHWALALESTSRCLKTVLLDQRVVAGLGNIYADEALFEARLHPTRKAQNLTPAERTRLRKAIVTVLERALARRGSSIRDYVDGSGSQGNYQDEFRVYGRTDQPCPRCRSPIQRIVMGGRSTHFCPRCQAPEESTPDVRSA
jgi:formamidopyrimidine-DNA glycosylase